MYQGMKLALMTHDVYNMKNSDASTHSMDEEIQLFMRKITKLEEIVHYLPPNSVVDKIQQRLDKIYQSIKTEGSLNAGGKFEWVDSVLIKCLQDGSWLLVDNVNLCSSAVLDRLNALLEPHGVLTVSERGVDSSGQMIEIKPHKDFRLFLAMDPKNGEISRAMRNRGIEIYMLNDAEYQDFHDIDRSSLIQLEGLNSSDAMVLIELHEYISELIIGENPNINELIQVSTLAAQQIKNGVKRSEAFTKTIIEIYFKTRSANEFSCNDFPQMICEKVDEFINVERNIPTSFNKNSTLRTQELSMNSAMEKIKQQGVLLFNRFENGVKMSDIDQEMYYLLLCFYSITSLKDLNFRHCYLNEKIKCDEGINSEAKNTLTSIITVLYDSILDYETSDSLPLDHNWTPEIFQDKSISRSNAMNLHLLNSLYGFRDYAKLTKHGIIRLEGNRPVVEKVKKGIAKVTLYEYACLVKNKTVEDHFNDIIIRNIADLMVEYEQLLRKILSDSDNIYNKDVIKIIYVLFWKSKFYELFQFDTDMDKKKLRKVFADLPVHYKWFYKFAILLLTEVTNVPIHDNLKDVLGIINSKLDKQFSIMHKLGKSFQKYSKRPPPFTNREQYEVVKEYNELYQQYNPSIKGNDIVQVFNNLKQKSGLRSSFIELKAELSYDFGDINEKIYLLSNIKNQIDLKPSNVYTRFELQLLPILDILAHLEARKSFLLKDCTTLVNNIVVPTDLSAAMVLYHKSKDERLLHEIHKSYYLYLIHSPSVALGKFLDTEDTELNEFSPKLTYYLTNLLIGRKEVENLGKVTLGNFRDSMKQHDALSMTLWGNLYQLSEEYDFISLEKRNIAAIYKKFLFEFTNSLKLEMDIKDSESPLHLTELIIMHIEKIQHENKNIELSTLSKKLNDCLNRFEKMNTVSGFEENVINISSLYQIISYLKAILNSKLSSIDPLTKKTLKRKYYSEASEMFDILKECYNNLNNVYSNRKETRHAYCECIEEALMQLKEKYDELSKYVAYRPDDIFYDTVSETINHAFSTIFSEDFVVEVNDTNREKIIQERSNKVASYENLIHGLSQFRNSFPDIVEPLLCNISEYLYGFKLYLSALKMQEAKTKQSYALTQVNCSDALASLIRFPYDNEKYNLSVMNKIVKYFLNDDEQYIQEQEYFRLLKCNIIDSINSAIIHSQPLNILSKSRFSQFNDLLNLFVSAYNKQQVDNEIKKKEEESLYKIKTKCDEKSEEEQIKQELDSLFPNYHTKDFADFDKSVDVDNNSDIQIEAKYDEVISYNDLKDVTEFHVKLLNNYTKSEWLNPTENKFPSPDFILPLLERFKTFSNILEKSMDSLYYKIDEDLIGSLNVLLAVKKRYGNIEDLTNEKNSKKKIDFYKDSNVEEVKSCYHILEDLKVKINKLLEDWPDQPTLNMIIVVIDRIYKFEITSPISRFLTGFEILLTKCHEWEEVAHSGVSLSVFTQNLTNQIIVWRKMELSLWKNVLNRVYEKLNESMPKWWLHLYNVMYQFIEEKKFGAKELIETLQTFMTKSNLGEFQGRLDLLYTFHCHAVYLERSKETDTFSSILWNIYIYFQQFCEVVAKKIKDLRSPIEKKVKEYVKIIRWKDVNYWAIKDAAEKSHKNLHKFMKEFQGVLEQPASPCLHNISTESSSQTVGIWDKAQIIYYTTLYLELDKYLIASSLFEETKSPKKFINKLISNLHKQTIKTRRYSKEIIEATPYPELVRILDNFVTEVIESSNRLQHLEIDTTLPKEKQKSQAKNILQQKHRALATLFKNLSKMGLSFKRGIIDSKVKDPTSDFVIKPIDLGSQFSHKSYGYKEEKILLFWESSEKYYVKSLMRLDVLETALNSPAKELGIQNMERLRGFGQEALTAVQKQKQTLVDSSRIYYYLRSYFKQIKEFCDGHEYLPSFMVDKIIDLLKYITKIINQYQIILNTCPEETSFNSENLEIHILKSSLEKRIIYKRDEMWSIAESRIILIKKTCDELISQFLHLNSVLPSTEYEVLKTKYVPVPKLNQVNIYLMDVKECVTDLGRIFGHIEMTKTLNSIQKEIDTVIKDISESNNFDNYFETDVSYNFDNEIESFSNKIVDILKKLRKKHKTDVSKSRVDESNEDELKDEHLNKLLIDNLSNDVLDLDMKTVLEQAHRIVSCLTTSPLETLESRKSLTNEVLPIMEQTILLYQYFVTQQVSAYRMSCKMASILLNIFIELASKGFCIPPEFSDELDKEGISKPSDGLGLGEGQGERDVSDKIESEDQLDDAQPAGKEKDTEEDNDCKEEEQGIEMSEDFDSKLQDKEKKEDDSESDSGDSDAEEQMGETDKGADQQNTETFGDENDQEVGEEEGSDEKEEKGDKGEKEGEEQLGAKEDKTSKNDEDEPQGKDEKEKSKKEINEMEEPEYDDQQIDPHHGQQQELPEPEPMDLPEDMQLDDGEANNEDDQNQEDNPFDIDTKKTEDKPEDKPDEYAEEIKDDESKRDEEKEFSSDDEDIEGADNKDAEEDKGDDNNENTEKYEESEKLPQEDETNEENGDESALDQTRSNQENIEAMEVDDAQAVDKAQANKSENQQSNQPIEELQQDDSPDQEGAGQSQKEENSSGHTAQTTAPLEMKTSKDNKDEEVQKRKQKPGETDSRRSLGDVDEPVKKKLKTVDTKNEENRNDDTGENPEENAEMYQHIKDAEKTKTQVLDVATKEQAENQKKETQHEDNKDDEPTKSSTDLPEDEANPEIIDVDDAITEKPEIVGETNDRKNKKQQHPQGEVLEELQDIDIEGELIKTSTVPRSSESSHHTQHSTIRETTANRLSADEVNSLRIDVEKQLSGWNEPPSTIEADQAWQKISSVTSSLAQDLSEQLRLVLEPTQASRLRGDFRTGRRINMRKVIPYIASQFRKDKIWLRRTKPSKREYQIVLAIDDSSSMADNHSKELAFESVALISKALTLLESGQLSVLGFGENVEVIHKLTDQFTDSSGIKLLQKFKFDQNKTCVAKLVDFATEMFKQSQLQSNTLNAKLLVIVSDGRGVFSEGERFVQQAVRRAKLSNIFMVFVIIDNPENKNSVLDIRMPVFKDGKLQEIQSYMDAFPFSFYIILRDINSLPSVLSDALRQWFEIVSNLDKQ